MAWVVFASLLLGIYNLLTYGMYINSRGIDSKYLESTMEAQEIVWQKLDIKESQVHLVERGYTVKLDQDDVGPYIAAEKDMGQLLDIFSHRVHILIRFESESAAVYHVYVSGNYF